MSKRLRIVNCADIVDPGWDFLQKPLANMPLDWHHFHATAQSRHARGFMARLVRWRTGWSAARCAARGPDCVVISHLPKVTLWTAVLCGVFSAKTRHIAFSFNFTGLPTGLRKVLMQWGFRRVDRFVVFSNAERMRYAEHFKIDPARIDFLPWMMEAPCASDARVVDGDYICAVGGEGRDYDTLVDAVRDAPHIKTVIVTRDYNVPRGPLPPNVVVHTEMGAPEFWNVVKHSRFVVLPLHDDQTCTGHITLVGALQLGRPIVATASRGIDDYVQPGVNALLVKAGDARALGAEIGRLWSDRELQERLHHAIERANRSTRAATVWSDYFRKYFENILARAADADAASGEIPRMRAEPLPRIELQTDGQRHAGGERREAALTISIAGVREGLDLLAMRHEAAPIGVAAAVFLTWLFRHTQQGDLALRVFRRSASSVSAEPAVVRVSLSHEQPFAAVVEQVQSQLCAAALDASGAASMPASNLVFGWSDEASGAGLALFGDGVDLMATVSLADDSLVLRLCYDECLYTTQRMQEMADQLASLARQAIAAPGLALAQYSLVTERGAAVIPDPHDVLDAPMHLPITEAILAWAQRQPDAPAVRHGGRDSTYAQLAQCSLRVALQVRAHGIGPGDVVAVTGERSGALVAAMVGVFRSGAVLLTLDPKLPAGRRRVMLEQAGARALVRVGVDQDGVDGNAIDLRGLDLAVIAMDARSAELLNALPVASQALPAVDCTQPAYVFFTSGSSGAPKGVKGTHAGLAHFLTWQRSEFGVGPGDRASQLTALSFDVVLRDMFLALTSGATLCIPDESDVLDPARIFRWLEQEQITTMHVVPSLARMWLNHVPDGVSLAGLRRIFFAGEPLTDVLVARWRSAFPGAFEIVNLYGPTETTLAKCFYRVPAVPASGVQRIGRTLPQTQALVINARRIPCGLHEAGEIAIRTPFRTLGYVGNPQANALAFVRNPFGTDPDDLLYLTGDSGRYGADGSLEILGRIDNQVKIRGMRIEPGEIEACLGRHPGVRDVVVMARDDSGGEKMLVAYVVARAGGPDADASACVAGYRQFLRERLPESMVPSAFVPLHALPLNPNGKIDKKALPQPGRDALGAGAFAEPQSALQGRVARVWGSVLGLPRVGIDDNFFDLGGHSLLAVQLVRAVAHELQRTCALPLLFMAPTVRSLCAALERNDANEGAVLMPLQRLGSGPALFCICGVYLYQGLARRLAPDIPVYGIFLPAEQALFESGAQTTAGFPTLEAMAADYVNAVRLQQPKGPYLLAGVSFGGVLAYEMAQQLTRAGERVEFLAILDSLLPAAVKRDWVQWGLKQLRVLRREGPGRLATKIHGRLRRVFASIRAGSGGAAAPDASSHEGDRLGAMRQAVYAHATRHYVARPYPAAVVLVRAQDTEFPKSDVADSTYGWGALVARLHIADVPGDHLGILREPHVEVLAQRLRSHLDRARWSAESAPPDVAAWPATRAGRPDVQADPTPVRDDRNDPGSPSTQATAATAQGSPDETSAHATRERDPPQSTAIEPLAPVPGEKVSTSDAGTESPAPTALSTASLRTQ